MAWRRWTKCTCERLSILTERREQNQSQSDVFPVGSLLLVKQLIRVVYAQRTNVKCWIGHKRVRGSLSTDSRGLLIKLHNDIELEQDMFGSQGWTECMSLCRRCRKHWAHINFKMSSGSSFIASLIQYRRVHSEADYLTCIMQKILWLSVLTTKNC